MSHWKDTSKIIFLLIVKRKWLPWSWLTNLAHTGGKTCFEVVTSLSFTPEVGQILKFGNKWMFSAMGISHTEFPLTCEGTKQGFFERQRSKCHKEYIRG